jgi:hypothetical protein
MALRERPATLKPVSRFSSESILKYRMNQRQKKTVLNIGPYECSDEELSEPDL